MPAVSDSVNLLGGGMPNEAQLEKAKGIVRPEETLYAVWTVSSEQAALAACLPLAPMLALPCFWPHMVFLSPCLCACVCMNKATLEGSITILTDKRIYRDIDTGGCCNQNQSGDLTLTQINSVGKQPLTPCGNCDLHAVTLGVPYGHTIANTGGSKHRAANKLQFVVDESTEAMRLINSARDNYSSNQPGVTAAPVPMVMAQPGFASSVVAAPMMVDGVQIAQPVGAMPVQPMEMARDPGDKMSIMDSIGALAKLNKDGILTDEEFAAKKAELLQRL